jgi:CheY-like chemotaxis protein
MDRHSPTIMLVDDDDPSREMIAYMLRDAGYIVQPFANPVAALHHMVQATPDLLVLDYAMPQMSGRDVLHMLPQVGLTALPVLVLSASPYAHASLAEGAMRVVTKPFLLSDLLTAIAECLCLPTAGSCPP